MSKEVARRRSRRWASRSGTAIAPRYPTSIRWSGQALASSAVAVLVLALSSAAALSGCGSSPITAARIEHAVAPTFANLVQTQVTWMGLPPLVASEVAATATCRRPGGEGAGSGDWVCKVIWKGPDGRSIRDSYDVLVGTDGCYTATVGSETLGGPTLRTADGRDVRNLLYAFDGCFDTM
ncbi:MAG: hypothetical protein ABI818_06550 [Acidobacteriota bacterium]